MGESEHIRLLLVEDDAEDAAIFRRYVRDIKGGQIDVVHVASEQEARSRMAQEPFDLVFVDLDLARGRSGMELLQRLQHEGMHIAAVVVTGSGDEMKAVEAMQAGAYDYLVKGSLNADLLERTIRNARRRHELEQERARMMEKLAELSVTDELTGLANRRRLEEKLEEETKRAERTGRSFAVLMIDLDHFKRVNDRYGHQVGDDVLGQCAAALGQTLRATDFVARYGGEEFCALLPDTAPGAGHRTAERLGKAVKALPEPVPTISVGMAYWEPGVSAEELVRRADEALYEAKRAGRDRVVVHGEQNTGGSSSS